MQTGKKSIRPGSWPIVALAVLAAGLLAACGGSGDTPAGIGDPGSGDQPQVTAPDGEEPPTEEPPAEEPPTEEPPAEEPPTEEDAADEGMTGEELAVVILVGVVVLALVIGAMALITRRSGGQGQSDGTNQRRLDDITRTSRSIHDSAVLTVLQTNDPARLQSLWGAGRGQLFDLESRIASLAPALPEAGQRQTLHELGQAVAGVRGALDSNVGLRLDPDDTGQAELIEASNRTVLYRSEQLEAALQRALMLRV